MREYYQLQARETEQGMELRLAEIKEKARWRAPGLLMDLIQIMKEVPDVTKQDIRWITEVQQQAILQKHEYTTYNKTRHREGLLCLYRRQRRHIPGNN